MSEKYVTDIWENTRLKLNIPHFQLLTQNEKKFELSKASFDRAVKKLKKDKATGPNMIGGELIRGLNDELIEELFKIVKYAWE